MEFKYFGQDITQQEIANAVIENGKSSVYKSEFFMEKEGGNMKIKYDYCRISPNKDKYIVEYGHNTYKGNILPSPIKIADRTFSTEKKAIRFAKKIVPPDYIKIEKN